MEQPSKVAPRKDVSILIVRAGFVEGRKFKRLEFCSTNGAAGGGRRGELIPVIGHNLCPGNDLYRKGRVANDAAGSSTAACEIPAATIIGAGGWLL
jgi:hypothetical protein